MDNEHTTITGRRANPSRPQQINSLSINDCSLFSRPPQPHSHPTCLTPTFSICQTAKEDERGAQINPKKGVKLSKKSWQPSVDGKYQPGAVCQCQSLTHSLSPSQKSIISAFLLKPFLSLEWQLASSLVGGGELPPLILLGDAAIFIFRPD